MRKLTLYLLTLATFIFASSAQAYDLNYMINPPEEKSMNELDAAIATKESQIAKASAELTKLKEERDQRLSELTPAAGESITTEEINTYDHYLGH